MAYSQIPSDGWTPARLVMELHCLCRRHSDDVLLFGKGINLGSAVLTLLYSSIKSRYPLYTTSLRITVTTAHYSSHSVCIADFTESRLRGNANLGFLIMQYDSVALRIYKVYFYHRISLNHVPELFPSIMLPQGAEETTLTGGSSR